MTAVQPSSRAGTIAIGTCREQSSNASSLWRKTQMSSVLEILILVMTSAPMDKTELAIFERLVCPIWNTGTRWLRETDLTKAKTFFTRNAQRRLGEYNRWAALARVPRSQIPRRCFVSTGCAKVQWSGTANYGIRLPDYQHPRSAAAPHCCALTHPLWRPQLPNAGAVSISPVALKHQSDSNFRSSAKSF